jgi:hypothetical protein
LRSPKVIHIVLKRQFKDFVKQLFFTHPMSSSLGFVFPTLLAKDKVKYPSKQNRSGLSPSKGSFSKFQGFEYYRAKTLSNSPSHFFEKKDGLSGAAASRGPA